MSSWIRGMALASFLSAALTATVTAGPEGEKEKKAGGSMPLCPISGKPADLSVSVEADDGPVFFCCRGCIPKYREETAKYTEMVAAQRTALAGREKVQVLCPVTGEPVDSKAFVESNGTKVYFCCPGCIKKYEKDPAKRHRALLNSFTYQTKCPVEGKPISPAVSADSQDGQTLYFCCKDCEKAFTVNPAKYASNLAAQGITIDPADWSEDEADGHDEHDHGDDDHDHDGDDHDHDDDHDH